jgi:hypothetical protein
VRTDFGKCAIVRFRLAADAAFLMFSLAAFLCLVEAIFCTPHLPSERIRNQLHLESNSRCLDEYPALRVCPLLVGVSSGCIKRGALWEPTTNFISLTSKA